MTTGFDSKVNGWLFFVRLFHSLFQAGLSRRFLWYHFHAVKRTVAIQLQQILESEHATKTLLAARMKTSRASLDRLLDPMNPSPTAASLGKAAAALGRKAELRFVPA